MLRFGPVVVGLSKLLRVPTVLRVFGGSFGDFYQDGNALTKAIMRRFVLSADVVLLQTKRAIRQLPPVGRLVWFSTYIKPVTPPPSLEERTCCTKFIFLGHLWRTKGIETILDAAPGLPADCSIDIYGPPDEYTADAIEQRGFGRVHYCGFLTHDQVEDRSMEVRLPGASHSSSRRGLSRRDCRSVCPRVAGGHNEVARHSRDRR